MTKKLTIVDAETSPYRCSEVAARVDGDRVFLGADAVAEALGWTLRDEGLCRGDVCVPVRERAALVSGKNEIDLAALAAVLDRPLACDAAAGAAVLGVSAASRFQQMQNLEAPDFELADLAGRMHKLSEHRGKKVLLIAHASW